MTQKQGQPASLGVHAQATTADDGSHHETVVVDAMLSDSDGQQKIYKGKVEGKSVLHSGQLGSEVEGLTTALTEIASALVALRHTGNVIVERQDKIFVILIVLGVANLILWICWLYSISPFAHR